MYARTRVITCQKLLIISGRLEITSKATTGALSPTRSESTLPIPPNHETQNHLSKRRFYAIELPFYTACGIPAKLDACSMSSGTGFHLNWNRIPDDMEQAYILAITKRFT